MNTTRRKRYERKPTRGRSPHPDLRRVVRILEYLCRNATQDPNEPIGPWITKFPAGQLQSEDDNPLRDHIKKLKRILAKQDAREVFGQTKGSGRPAKTDEHRTLADFYLS